MKVMLRTLGKAKHSPKAAGGAFTGNRLRWPKIAAQPQKTLIGQ
jgi:hypothetical protein